MKRNRVNKLESQSKSTPSPSSRSMELRALLKSMNVPTQSSLTTMQTGLEKMNAKMTTNLNQYKPFPSSVSKLQSNLGTRYAAYKAEKYQKLNSLLNDAEKNANGDNTIDISLSNSPNKVYTPLQSPLVLTQEDKAKEKANLIKYQTKSIQKVLDWNCQPIPSSAASSHDEGMEHQNFNNERAKSPRKRLIQITPSKVLEEARLEINKSIAMKNGSNVDEKSNANIDSKVMIGNRLNKNGDLNISSTKMSRNERVKERLKPFTFSKEQLLKQAKQRAQNELRTTAASILPTSTNNHNDTQAKNENEKMLATISNATENSISQQPKYVSYIHRSPRRGRIATRYGRRRFESRDPYHGDDDDDDEGSTNHAEFGAYITNISIPPGLEFGKGDSQQMQSVHNKNRIEGIPAETVVKKQDYKERYEARLQDIKLDRIKALAKDVDKTKADAKEEKPTTHEYGKPDEKAPTPEDGYSSTSLSGSFRQDSGRSSNKESSASSNSPSKHKHYLKETEASQIARVQTAMMLQNKKFHLDQLKSMKDKYKVKEWDSCTKLPSCKSKEKIRVTDLIRTRSNETMQYFSIPNNLSPVSPDSWDPKNTYQPGKQNVRGRRSKRPNHKESVCQAQVQLQNNHLYNSIKNAKSSYSRTKQLNDYQKHQAYVLCQRPVACLDKIRDIKRANDKVREAEANNPAGKSLQHRRCNQ